MESRIFIENFDCVTSVSSNKEELWEALSKKEIGLKKINVNNWPKKVKTFWENQPFPPHACLIQDQINNDSTTSINEIIVNRLQIAFKNSITPDSDLTNSELGIIFATTKGAIEDFVWEKPFQQQVGKGIVNFPDPLDATLQLFLNNNKNLNVVCSQVVSNACASSHAAFYLGKKWLENNLCEKVIVLSADFIGPFVMTGFQSLKAMSPSTCMPFQDDRTGLILGEAATAVILTLKETEFELSGVSINNEAHTVTSPSPEGRGLFQCIKDVIPSFQKPDILLAHGTATYMNDLIEDTVFSRAQKELDSNFPILATKWSIGHCLGASGSVDLIASLMCMKKNHCFSIPAKEVPTKLSAKNYLFNSNKKMQINSALITSLGFGGTNSALLVTRKIQ
jgi:3-oxoacyl-(acyl-carrier-protein) synthase